ncbi:MFS transporter [Gordonibacter massiliensis (ex Traore et al. 2017)]|uniref:MFS transporter n=1 Tax=Gordonibacter massiliensis (ex Traore et al. 2017) TaxID=1841863 RepID=UPI001C8C8CCD|nr:MFS transporter [Gordonibacter massiliensis (ex Traore et al. 2017)]MBX9032592.1 MFS transporter [Gordonibacter massiliensis (ex Traore et al. 2017)]
MEEKKKKIHYAWVVLVACCGMTSSMGILFNSRGQWLLPVTTEMGMSTTEFALLFTLGSIGLGIMAPVVGRALPKVNVRILLTGCAIVVLATCFAMAFFNESWMWPVSGLVIGIAGAFVFIVPTPIILGNWFVKKTGFVTGIALAAMGIAGAIANPIAAALISSMGWRSACLVIAAIGAVVLLPCTIFLVRFKPEDMGLLPYGADAVSSESAETPAVALANEGVSAKRALRSLSFWLMFISITVFSMLGGYAQLLPMYAESQGLPEIVGLVATACMAGMFVGNLLLGALGDRFGGLPTTIIGTIILVCGILLLMFLGFAAIPVLVGGLLYGVVPSLTQVVPPLVCREVFGNKDFPKLYSTLNVAVSLVGAFGAVIVALILDTTGNDFIVAFSLGLGFAAFAVVAIVFSMVSGKKIAATPDRQVAGNKETSVASCEMIARKER